MSQSWIEITLEVDKAEAEDWADALLEAGALSVQAEDADADSPDEQPLFGEPVPPGLPGTGAGYLPQTFGWKRTRLAVLLDATEDDSAAGRTPAPANLAVLQEAADSLEKPLPDIVGTRRVDDQDWVRLTQAQFDPIPVGQRLLILPSWHAAETQAGDREALIIDPGLAFGTGSHRNTSQSRIREYIFRKHRTSEKLAYRGKLECYRREKYISYSMVFYYCKCRLASGSCKKSIFAVPHFYHLLPCMQCYTRNTYDT